MPILLFGNKRPDKQLVIAVHLSSVLGTVTLVPDPPTLLATEPLRLFLALFISLLPMGLALVGWSPPGCPGWVLVYPVGLE